MGAKDLKELEPVKKAEDKSVDKSNIDYESLEKARTAQLQAQLRDRLRQEFGNGIDGLRRVVLKSVVNADYKKANQSLDNYIILKEEYPDFHPRVVDMIRHSRELINAIRSKRNLPGLSQLSIAKQKEIMDHVVSHFNELKYTLKAVERVAKDVALSDIRSTVWLIKTVSYCLLGILVVAFSISFTEQIAKPFWVVSNDLVNKMSNAFFTMLGL
jgi:hypothetical protein